MSKTKILGKITNCGLTLNSVLPEMVDFGSPIKISGSSAGIAGTIPRIEEKRKHSLGPVEHPEFPIGEDAVYGWALNRKRYLYKT